MSVSQVFFPVDFPGIQIHINCWRRQKEQKTAAGVWRRIFLYQYTFWIRVSTLYFLLIFREPFSLVVEGYPILLTKMAYADLRANKIERNDTTEKLQEYCDFQRDWTIWYTIPGCLCVFSQMYLATFVMSKKLEPYHSIG